MEGQDQILQGFNTALKGLGEMRNALLKTLTPEQAATYSKFEQNYSKLQKSGDLLGAEKLKAEFNEAMK